MKIVRCVGANIGEVAVRIVVRRDDHPLLYQRLSESIGPERASFIRDALERVLADGDGRNAVAAPVVVAPEPSAVRAVSVTALAASPPEPPEPSVDERKRDGIKSVLLNSHIA